MLSGMEIYGALAYLGGSKIFVGVMILGIILCLLLQAKEMIIIVRQYSGIIVAAILACIVIIAILAHITYEPYMAIMGFIDNPAAGVADMSATWLQSVTGGRI